MARRPKYEHLPHSLVPEDKFDITRRSDSEDSDSLFSSITVQASANSLSNSYSSTPPTSAADSASISSLNKLDAIASGAEVDDEAFHTADEGEKAESEAGRTRRPGERDGASGKDETGFARKVTAKNWEKGGVMQKGQILTTVAASLFPNLVSTVQKAPLVNSEADEPSGVETTEEDEIAPAEKKLTPEEKRILEEERLARRAERLLVSEARKAEKAAKRELRLKESEARDAEWAAKRAAKRAELEAQRARKGAHSGDVASTRATRSTGEQAQNLTEKLSVLGKRSRNAFEAGLGKAARELKKLIDTNEYAGIETKPVIHEVWANGKLWTGEEPPKKKTKKEVEPEKPVEAEVVLVEEAPKFIKRREKVWLKQGLYAGQEGKKLDVFFGKTAQGNQQNDFAEYNPKGLMPLPMWKGQRLLQWGRDFKLPFDVCNPLPPGQPKPDEWRKVPKNRFVGDAAAAWKKSTVFDDFSSRCICSIASGCGDTCQNRIMLYECDDANCSLGREHCTNRAFQDLKDRRSKGGKYRTGVEVIKTADRGYGVRTNRCFDAHQIIVEYTGEIITEDECDRRMNEIYKNNECYYLMLFDQNMIIDATRGSIARFVNHSCEPNCRMVKWVVAGKPRMALFTGDRPLMTGEELTYDYNFDPFSAKNVQECRCGAENCRGILGPRPKEKSGKRKLSEEEGETEAEGRAKKKSKIMSPSKKTATKTAKAKVVMKGKVRKASGKTVVKAVKRSLPSKKAANGTIRRTAKVVIVKKSAKTAKSRVAMPSFAIAKPRKTSLKEISAIVSKVSKLQKSSAKNAIRKLPAALKAVKNAKNGESVKSIRTPKSPKSVKSFQSIAKSPKSIKSAKSLKSKTHLGLTPTTTPRKDKTKSTPKIKVYKQTTLFANTTTTTTSSSSTAASKSPSTRIRKPTQKAIESASATPTSARHSSARLSVSAPSTPLKNISRNVVGGGGVERGESILMSSGGRKRKLTEKARESLSVERSPRGMNKMVMA